MTNEEAKLTIEYLKEMQEKYIEGEGYERHPIPEWYALDKAIETIEQTTWIPVSERLPEEETDVLICNSKGQIEVSCGSKFDDGTWEWYTSGWHYGEVVAWMPLPTPYEPQESEKQK